MPLYEYRCEECGYQFESLRSMKDADAVISCKRCQSNQTKRRVSKCVSHSQSGGGASSASGCGSCSGGSCSSCRH